MVWKGYAYTGERPCGTLKGDVAKMLSFKHTEQVKYMKKTICEKRGDSCFNISIMREDKETLYDRHRKVKGSFYVHRYTSKVR